MKIYTNTFDLSRPAPHRFWVSPYSDFKIGIKIVNAGVEVENDFTVAAGTTELIPDESKVDGFTIYTLNSTDTGFVEYTITLEGIVQKFKLVQIISDSTVFEVGGTGGGGDLSEYAKKTWVEEQISGFVTEDALSDFITAEDLTAYATKDELTGYVETTDLTAYYTKSETSSAAEIGTALEGKQPTGNYLTAETEPAFAAMSADIVVDGDLTAYATVDSLSDYATYNALSGVNDTAVSALSKAEDAYSMADSAQQQLGSKVDHFSGGMAPEVLNITTYYESEYAQLSVDDPTWEPDMNTMYVILPDQV